MTKTKAFEDTRSILLEPGKLKFEPEFQKKIDQREILTCAVIMRSVCVAPAATSIGHFEQSSLGLHAVRAVLPKLVSSSPVLACC